MNRINTPIGFRYSSDEHGIANLFLGLEHGVAATRRNSPIEAGTPIVAYVTDAVRRGTHVCIGMAVGSAEGVNPWGPEYETRTIYEVRWVGAPVWVPADEVWATSTSWSSTALEQLMAAALAA